MDLPQNTIVGNIFPIKKIAKSDKIINSTLDMRLPLTFSLEDCRVIATIIRQEVEARITS